MFAYICIMCNEHSFSPSAISSERCLEAQIRLMNRTFKEHLNGFYKDPLNSLSLVSWKSISISHMLDYLLSYSLDLFHLVVTT